MKDRGELKRSLQLVDGYSSAPDLAKLINDAFLSPLSEDFYPAEEASASPVFVVSSDAVYLNQFIPILKQKPIKDVNKHLRPISLTPVLSKVAEEFVDDQGAFKTGNTQLLKKIGGNQSGAIPNSSTTRALISMVHSWTKYTDGTGFTVRVVLFDYRKAFDLIDHTLLVRKLLTLDIPYGITCWIINFLKNYQQRVKLERECMSEWRKTPAGSRKVQNWAHGYLSS